MLEAVPIPLLDEISKDMAAAIQIVSENCNIDMHSHISELVQIWHDIDPTVPCILIVIWVGLVLIKLCGYLGCWAASQPWFKATEVQENQLLCLITSQKFSVDSDWSWYGVKTCPDEPHTHYCLVTSIWLCKEENYFLTRYHLFTEIFIHLDAGLNNLFLYSRLQMCEEAKVCSFSG